MKLATHTLSIFAPAAFAACFGAGPVPSLPSGATVMFMPPASSQPCLGVYVGDVAFGSSFGYAITLPYSNNNDGCGGGGPTLPIDVFQFSLDGATSVSIGGAGTAGGNDGGAPRIIVVDDAPLWVYPSNSSSGLTEGPSGSTLGSANGGGILVPVGMVTDGTTTYVAALQGNSSGTDVESPDYPDTQNQGTIGFGQGQFDLIGPGPGSGSPPTPMFDCGAANHCLAANPTDLYYFGTSQSGQGPNLVVIEQLSKADNSTVQVGSIPAGFAGAPVGIAATPTEVAWAASIDYENTSDVNETGCTITKASDLTSATPSQMVLLSTTRFSCMGLSIDADENAAYFAIVSVIVDDNHGGNAYMSGKGIGRIDLSTGDFTSVDLGISGESNGPRRVHPQDEFLYAIDPEAIAQIAKSSLVGHHDFTP